jgi:hypothetical protein
MMEFQPAKSDRSTAGHQEKDPMRNPTGMQIVRRAYQLWEQAGKPEGRDQEFYHEAERQLRNEEEPKESPENS